MQVRRMAEGRIVLLFLHICRTLYYLVVITLVQYKYKLHTYIHTYTHIHIRGDFIDDLLSSYQTVQILQKSCVHHSMCIWGFLFSFRSLCFFLPRLINPNLIGTLGFKAVDVVSPLPNLQAKGYIPSGERKEKNEDA